MDDKLFKELLSQVADWRIPETITGTKDGSAKKHRKRGRPSLEDIYMEQQEQEFLERTGGVNETFPPQVVKLKTQACVCEDCGKECPNGRQKEKKLYTTGTKKNWRERCVTCGMSRNPFTGDYDLPSSKASFVWTDYLKDRKGVYNTKKNQAREQAGVITFYPDGKPSE